MTSLNCDSCKPELPSHYLWATYGEGAPARAHLSAMRIGTEYWPNYRLSSSSFGGIICIGQTIGVSRHPRSNAAQTIIIGCSPFKHLPLVEDLHGKDLVRGLELDDAYLPEGASTYHLDHLEVVSRKAQRLHSLHHRLHCGGPNSRG